MDAETIKTLGIAVISAITTLGLAYIAARWHKTGGPPDKGSGSSQA